MVALVFIAQSRLAVLRCTIPMYSKCLARLVVAPSSFSSDLRTLLRSTSIESNRPHQNDDAETDNEEGQQQLNLLVRL